MTEIYGDYVDITDDIIEYLILSFSSSTLPIQERWRTNSLSADFLAEYWGAFFPLRGGPASRERHEVKDAVSYIANELLENAIKFSYKDTMRTIRVGLYMSDADKELRFYVSNCVDPSDAESFKSHIRMVLSSNTDEMYIRQMEKNAENEECTESKLGFFTLINDYHVRMAWKFEETPGHAGVETVTTMVGLAVVRDRPHQSGAVC